MFIFYILVKKEKEGKAMSIRKKAYLISGLSFILILLLSISFFISFQKTIISYKSTLSNIENIKNLSVIKKESTNLLYTLQKNKFYFSFLV